MLFKTALKTLTLIKKTVLQTILKQLRRRCLKRQSCGAQYYAARSPWCISMYTARLYYCAHTRTWLRGCACTIINAVNSML